MYSECGDDQLQELNALLDVLRRDVTMDLSTLQMMVVVVLRQRVSESGDSRLTSVLYFGHRMLRIFSRIIIHDRN